MWRRNPNAVERKEKKSSPHLNPSRFPHKEQQSETELLQHRWDTQIDTTERFSYAFDFLFSPRVKTNLGKDRHLSDEHEHDTQYPTPNAQTVLFCFQQALHLPTLRNKSSSYNQPGVTGLLPFRGVSSFGSQEKSIWDIRGSPETEQKTMILLLDRLVRHRPDLLVLCVGNEAGRPICTSGETPKEAIPASPLLTKFSHEWICWKENLLADPCSSLDNLSPLLTQLQNLDISEKPVLCCSLLPAPNLQSSRIWLVCVSGSHI